MSKLHVLNNKHKQASVKDTVHDLITKERKKFPNTNEQACNSESNEAWRYKVTWIEEERKSTGRQLHSNLKY